MHILKTQHHVVLKLPEIRLSIRRKNLRNRASLLSHDFLIRIDLCQSIQCSEPMGYRRFSSPHKSDQCDVFHSFCFRFYMIRSHNSPSA